MTAPPWNRHRRLTPSRQRAPGLSADEMHTSITKEEL